jgi:hypothetical protein
MCISPATAVQTGASAGASAGPRAPCGQSSAQTGAGPVYATGRDRLSVEGKPGLWTARTAFAWL